MTTERTDFQLWADYKNAGGRLSYSDWRDEGRPGAPAEKGLRFPWQTVTGEGFIAPWTSQVARPTQEGIRFAQPRSLAQRQAEEVLGQVPAPQPERVEPTTQIPEPPAWIGTYEPPPFPTEKPPEGYDWKWDSSSMRYVLTKRPGAAPISEYQRRQIELAEEEAERAQELSRWQEEQVRLEEEERARALEQQEWQRQQAEQQAAQERDWQQEQLGWQQEQARMQQQQWQQQFGWQQEQAQTQQAEQERRYGAQLAAQPRSWLEYASYTGEQPAIQPWMLPLMPQQYAGTVAGAPIPGFEAGAPTMAQLPQLTTPSAQLWGRMGPTAQQQYAGYKQARTGIRPEETQWRRQQAAPPGGRFGGLRWSR